MHSQMSMGTVLKLIDNAAGWVTDWSTFAANLGRLSGLAPEVVEQLINLRS